MSFINATQAAQKVLKVKETNKYMIDYQQAWFIENYNTFVWQIIWCDWTDDFDLRLATIGCELWLITFGNNVVHGLFFVTSDYFK